MSGDSCLPTIPLQGVLMPLPSSGTTRIHTYIQLIQNNKINLFFKGGLDYKLQTCDFLSFKHEVLRDDYIDKKQNLLRIPVPFCLIPTVLCDLNGFTHFNSSPPSSSLSTRCGINRQPFRYRAGYGDSSENQKVSLSIGLILDNCHANGTDVCLQQL